MTEQPVRQFDTGRTTAPVAEGEKVGFLRVLRDQRKVLWVALVLVVAGFWILLQVGEPLLATCIAIGIVLGLANHLMTEFWLLRLIASGEQPPRKRLAAATFARLAVLTVIAVGIAVA